MIAREVGDVGFFVAGNGVGRLHCALGAEWGTFRLQSVSMTI